MAFLNVKSPGIDLRVVYDPKELIVRIQDNCPAFNVERQIAMTISRVGIEDGEHLGLRILRGMVSDIVLTDLAVDILPSAGLSIVPDTAGASVVPTRYGDPDVAVELMSSRSK